MNTLETSPLPIGNGIYTQPPNSELRKFEAWRRKFNWVDTTNTGLYHHVNHGQVKTFEELLYEYKQSI